MNPYEILGVSSSASEAEIKAAYRTLVKKFHPDVVGEGSTNKMAQLNDAYDLLTDPVKRASYDAPPIFAFVNTVAEEPAEEKYDREYLDRKSRIAREKKQRRLTRERRTHKLMRFATYPILIFAAFLLLDYVLPTKDYHEPAEVGWQKMPRSKYSGRKLTKYSGRNLTSYMKTNHFTLQVPDTIHVYYDYNAEKKEVLDIRTTRILHIPLYITLMHRDAYVSFNNSAHIHSFMSAIPALLFCSCLVNIKLKKYTKLSYLLCFLPFMFLAIALIILF